MTGNHADPPRRDEPVADASAVDASDGNVPAANAPAVDGSDGHVAAVDASAVDAPDGDVAAPETTARPTRASTAVVVLATAIVTALLARATALALPVALGTAGAAALVAGLWTLRGRRDRAHARLLAAWLATLGGAGLLAGTLGATVVLLGRVFPVETVAGVPAGVVSVGAGTLVVVALAAAVGGALATARGLVRVGVVGDLSVAALHATLPVFAVGTLLAVESLLALAGTSDIVPFGSILATAGRALASPPADRPQFAGFLLLVGLASLATDRALRALPIAELLTGTTTDVAPGPADPMDRAVGGGSERVPSGDTGAPAAPASESGAPAATSGENGASGEASDVGGAEPATGRALDDGTTAAAVEAIVARAHLWLYWSGVTLLAAFPLGGFLDVLLPVAQLEAALGPSAVGVLTAVTTAPWLRSLALWTIVVAALVVAFVAGVRRLAAASATGVGPTVAPFLAGGVATLAAVLLGDPAVTAGVDWLVAAVPETAAPAVRSTAVAAVTIYGPGTLLVGTLLAGLLVGTGVLASGWLSLASLEGGEWRVGPTLAGGGLALAGAFAATVGAGTVTVLLAVGGGLLAWDAGSYGTVLRRTVGTAPGTRATEIAHLGGTALAVAAGAVVAVALLVGATGAVASASAGLAGLAFAVVALAVLAAAAR